MAWEDKVHNLLGHCKSPAAFGGDFTHQPEDWPEQTLKGVFSDTFIYVDPETGMKVRSTEPNIGVRLVDMNRQPKKNDVIRRNGIKYSVRIIEPDGEGGATLVLERIKE